MNLLFLCHRLPCPPSSGARIRPFHILRHWARTHRVTVATLRHDDDEDEEALARLAHRVLLARVRPSVGVARAVARVVAGGAPSLGFFWSPQLARSVRELVAHERFDFVFVHSAAMGAYVADLDVPKLIDFGDMDSQKWLAYGDQRRLPGALAFRLEAQRLRGEEARLAAAFDAATCTTRAEHADLQSIAVPRRSDWFANGVDADTFHPAAGDPEADRVCFIGRMDYHPNVDAMIRFCQETWPRVRRRRPRSQLAIIGANPVRAIRALGRDPSIEVTGTVADVRPHAWRAAVSVAPLGVARGIQNKVIEAMAMGIPVVASSAAAHGVDAIAGEHLSTADDPDATAAAIIRLLDDPTERRRLAQAGRERMLSHHSWPRVLAKLDAMIAAWLGIDLTKP